MSLGYTLADAHGRRTRRRHCQRFQRTHNLLASRTHYHWRSSPRMTQDQLIHVESTVVVRAENTNVVPDKDIVNIPGASTVRPTTQGARHGRLVTNQFDTNGSESLLSSG